jgi:hypothetical protein
MGCPVYIIIEKGALLGELFEEFPQIKLNQYFISFSDDNSIYFSFGPSTVSETD